MRVSQACLALSSALFGCSLLVEGERVQCREDLDCGRFADAAPYQCVQGFCRAFACRTDEDCQAQGPLVCEQQKCAPAQCVAAEDCSSTSEACVSGRCRDAVFGCFYEQAASVSEQPAELRMNVVAYVDKRPLQRLDVKVCAFGDTPCNTPINVRTQYDAAGELRIMGLENRARYGIRLLGTSADGTRLIESEYYMLRPVVGVTTVQQRIELVSPTLVELFAVSAGTTWNRAEGLVFVSVFGCDQKPLAGVSFTDSRGADPYYFTGTASLDVAETDFQGQGGFVNMEVGNMGVALLHKLTIVYKGQSLFSVSVTPRPGVLTLLDVEMRDYGTTADRAAAVPK